jgi:hypothetical protein
MASMVLLLWSKYVEWPPRTKASNRDKDRVTEERGGIRGRHTLPVRRRSLRVFADRVSLIVCVKVW